MKITRRWVGSFVAALLAVKPVADLSAALPDFAFLTMVFGIAIALTVVIIRFGQRRS